MSGVIFSVVMSYSDNGVESMLNNFSFSIKLGGSEEVLDNGIRMKKFFDRLEKWPELTRSVYV